MWQPANNTTSYPKSYEVANQATSCQYPFLLAKTKSLTSNNPKLVGPNKINDRKWSNKSLNASKPYSFY